MSNDTLRDLRVFTKRESPTEGQLTRNTLSIKKNRFEAMRRIVGYFEKKDGQINFIVAIDGHEFSRKGAIDGWQIN